MLPNSFHTMGTSALRSNYLNKDSVGSWAPMLEAVPRGPPMNVSLINSFPCSLLINPN